MRKLSSNQSLHDYPLMYQITLLSVFPLSLLLKIVQFKILPQKFFFDSTYILGLMENDELKFQLSSSYNNTAFFFKSINLFHCKTLLEWSILISAIFNIYLLFLLCESKIKDVKDWIMAIFLLGVTNIYIFNVSKDIIQFVIFAIIAFIIKLPIKSYKKAIAVILVFYLESVTYRSYYILTAFFLLALSVTVPKLINNKLERKKKISFILILFVLFFTVFLYLCKIVFPDDYIEMVEIRNNINLHRIGSESAKTAIINLIDSNDNILLFMANYIINALRIMLPIELITKGVYYYPFMVFQFIVTFITLYGFVNYKKINDIEKISLLIFSAYLLVSFFFEPDFGSFVRHEAATAPVLIMIMFSRNECKTKVVD